MELIFNKLALIDIKAPIIMNCRTKNKIAVNTIKTVLVKKIISV